MPIVAPELFKGIADRLSKQWQFLVNATQEVTAKGGGLFYPRLHDGTGVGGNYSVEGDLIAAANSTDTILHDSGIMADSYFATLINALNTHVTNQGADDLNAYLNISGINVSAYYEEVYYQVRGSHLEARNVFSPYDQETMATVDVSASGVGVFTDGVALGTGTGDVSTTNHAAGMLHIVLQSGITPTDTILNLQLLAELYPDGSVATSANVTVPAGTAAGELISVGTSGVNTYLDVTNVITAGGVSGEQFKVLSQLERVIAL
jgi:hypothetical protein